MLSFLLVLQINYSRIEIKLVPCPQVCADVVASLVGSLPSVGPGQLSTYFIIFHTFLVIVNVGLR